MSILPNNRLILNGHKILDQDQLFTYLSKRLKTAITTEQDLLVSLQQYSELQIAIWHGDTFLQAESAEIRQHFFSLLQQCGSVKITGLR